MAALLCAAAVWCAAALPAMAETDCFGTLSITGSGSDSGHFTCADGRRFGVRLADLDFPEPGACPAADRLRLAADAALRPLFAAAAARWLDAGRPADRWGRRAGDAELADGRRWSALAAAAGARPWPHDARNRPLAPRPAHCLRAPLPPVRP